MKERAVLAQRMMTPTDTPDYLRDLNPEQRLAVETTEGPVLILAGAGTGKTRVLTTRLAHILRCGLARPHELLSVTFTNKAASEMRHRVTDLVGRMSEGLWLGTFHALGARILRRHGELLGLRTDFTILDMDDQHRLLKQVLQAQGIDDKKNPPKMAAAIIGRWKDRGLSPEKVTAAEAGKNRMMLSVYKEYQERLSVLNAADFGDLLLHCLTLFEKFPEVLKSYQEQFKYILVDEYQDTNVAQYLWLRLLAMGHGNVCCVGDDDQSIYAWRGAEVGNILRFEQDFPGSTVVRLEQNYRSTPHILAAASALISHNEGRFGKTLWTDVNEGEKVLVRGTWDSNDEARFVGEEIENHQRYGTSLSEMAILVRAGFQTREFEDRLLTLGVPYRVIGGLRFYERQEIRDALAYLRLVVQPDDGLAFERIINVPRRGMGAATLQMIQKEARSAGISVPRAARELMGLDMIKGAARTALRTFFADLDRWRQKLSDLTPAELTQIILDESGYTQMWREDKSVDAPGRLENLKELVAALKEFDTLSGFIEHVSLVMDATANNQDDMVNIMTLHSAKGLEFDLVFLPGWEEGMFPHPRSLDESGTEGLEEERRLAYVGITRAKRQAIITHTHNRKTYQGWQYMTQSRFVSELPTDHVIIVQANGSEILGGTRISTYRQTPGMGASRQIPRSKVFDADFSDISHHDLKVGDRVFHDKFGYGRVEEVDGDSIKVDFETSGVKSIMADYLGK